MVTNEDGRTSILLAGWPSGMQVKTVAVTGEWQVDRNRGWKGKWEERVTKDSGAFPGFETHVLLGWQ